MARNKKPRKAYRPGRVNCLAIANALHRASCMTPAEVDMVMTPIEDALNRLASGSLDPGHDWCVLADAVNISAELALAGILSNDSAVAGINAGRDALAELCFGANAGGSWVLAGQPLEAVTHAMNLHAVQLSHCSIGEYERAIRSAINKIRGAKSGTPASGTVVIEGAIHRCEGMPV